MGTVEVKQSLPNAKGDIDPEVLEIDSAYGRGENVNEKILRWETRTGDRWPGFTVQAITDRLNVDAGSAGPIVGECSNCKTKFTRISMRMETFRCPTCQTTKHPIVYAERLDFNP